MLLNYIHLKWLTWYILWLHIFLPYSHTHQVISLTCLKTLRQFPTALKMKTLPQARRPCIIWLLPLFLCLNHTTSPLLMVLWPHQTNTPNSFTSGSICCYSPAVYALPMPWSSHPGSHVTSSESSTPAPTTPPASKHAIIPHMEWQSFFKTLSKLFWLPKPWCPDRQQSLPNPGEGKWHLTLLNKY